MDSFVNPSLFSSQKASETLSNTLNATVISRLKAMKTPHAWYKTKDQEIDFGETLNISQSTANNQEDKEKHDKRPSVTKNTNLTDYEIQTAKNRQAVQISRGKQVTDPGQGACVAKHLSRIDTDDRVLDKKHGLNINPTAEPQLKKYAFPPKHGVQAAGTLFPRTKEMGGNSLAERQFQLPRGHPNQNATRSVRPGHISQFPNTEPQPEPDKRVKNMSNPQCFNRFNQVVTKPNHGQPPRSNQVAQIHNFAPNFRLNQANQVRNVENFSQQYQGGQVRNADSFSRPNQVWHSGPFSRSIHPQPVHQGHDVEYISRPKKGCQVGNNQHPFRPKIGNQVGNAVRFSRPNQGGLFLNDSHVSLPTQGGQVHNSSILSKPNEQGQGHNPKHNSIRFDRGGANPSAKFPPRFNTVRQVNNATLPPERHKVVGKVPDFKSFPRPSHPHMYRGQSSFGRPVYPHQRTNDLHNRNFLHEKI